MTAFNFFSHGTQDLYPTFLQVQHDMSPGGRLIAVIYNIGAIIGGIVVWLAVAKGSADVTPSSSPPSFRSP